MCPASRHSPPLRNPPDSPSDVPGSARPLGAPLLRSKSVVVLLALAVASMAGWWFGDQRRAPTRAIESSRCSTATRSWSRAATSATPSESRYRYARDAPSDEAGGMLRGGGVAYTKRRLAGRVVRLEDDVETHDIYGRRLAYVYVDGPASTTSCSRGLRAPPRDRAQPRARPRDARQGARRQAPPPRPLGRMLSRVGVVYTAFSWLH